MRNELADLEVIVFRSKRDRENVHCFLFLGANIQVTEPMY